jgi:hypothetical protein
MKALSFRQPWAELILQRRKTLDMRTYTTHHRGPLAIHASKIIEQQACLRYGLDPKKLKIGGIVGLVELIDVIRLTKTDYDDLQTEHLSSWPYQPYMHGWVLRNPRRLPEMVPGRGQMKLFNVDLSLKQINAAKADFRPPSVHQIKEAGLYLGNKPKTVLTPIERPPEEIARIEHMLEAWRQTFDPDELEDWERSRKDLWTTWRPPI